MFVQSILILLVLIANMKCPSSLINQSHSEWPKTIISFQTVQQNGQKPEWLRGRELERRRHTPARAIFTAATTPCHDGFVLSAATAGCRGSAINCSPTARKCQTSRPLQARKRLSRGQHSSLGPDSRPEHWTARWRSCHWSREGFDWPFVLQLGATDSNQVHRGLP